jgi:predicted Rossmann-fold nucleotide-binding protein
VIGLPMRPWGGLTPSSFAAELRWCDTYQERIGHLLSCDAVVGLDGGIGTLSELTVVWAAAQTEPDAPVVVTVGPAWKSVLDVVGERMMVGDEDLRLVTSVDEAAEVVTAVRAGRGAHRVAMPRG